MKINEIIGEWVIMPQSIKPMGLIHKPGTGPNNRFDFKNKGNNRANEIEKEDAAGVGIVTKQNTTPDVNGGTLNKMLRNLRLMK